MQFGPSCQDASRRAEARSLLRSAAPCCAGEVRLAKTALKFVWPECNSAHPARTHLPRHKRGRSSDPPHYKNDIERIMNKSDLQLIATEFFLAARASPQIDGASPRKCFAFTLAIRIRDRSLAALPAGPRLSSNIGLSRSARQTQCVYAGMTINLKRLPWAFSEIAFREAPAHDLAPDEVFRPLPARQLTLPFGFQTAGQGARGEAEIVPGRREPST